jgi:Apea-like HEPN
MRDMHDDFELRSAGREFVAQAFAVLTESHVVPPSVYNPYVAVGRDYQGSDVMGLREYGMLESLLEADYPERFAKPLERGHGQFPSTYIFSFLEASIARCAREGDFEPTAEAVERSLDELLAVLDSPSYTAACCRHVCHLTTESGGEVRIGDVTVLPEPLEFGGLNARIQMEIPGAARAWNGEDPRPYVPPHALLIVNETTEDPRTYEICESLSRRLDHFMLVARLLTAGTVQGTYEVSGTTTLVSRRNPLMRRFDEQSFVQLVRRTVRLSGHEGPAFTALSNLLTSAEVPGQGMVTTSFGIAFSRFSGSYGGIWYENLVDLATALEAILIGDIEDNRGLTKRLKKRAAALLATDQDPQHVISADVAVLYNLRSRIVHGGQLTEAALREEIGKISTVPADDAEHRLGVALGRAVDRMRDLVRRAILARLCLAAKPASLWPFVENASVDEIFAQHDLSEAWRAHWHAALEALGVGKAGSKASPPTHFLERDVRPTAARYQGQ